MKKLFALLLVMTLSLTACGTQQAENIQSQYARLATAEMEAEIVCHLSAESRSFTLQCTYDRKNGATTTVTAPEELAGLTAAISADGLTVSYQGTAFSVETLSDICPANCLPYLLNAIAQGYLLSQDTEEMEGVSCCRLTLDTTGHSGEKVLCTVWIDAETLIPRYAEFTQNDQTVLTAKMLAFSCTTDSGAGDAAAPAENGAADTTEDSTAQPPAGGAAESVTEE